MRKARFPVYGRLHMASKAMPGTVIVNRAASLFGVRPKHSRRVYELPLSDVATMVCQRIHRAEEFKRRIERAAKRKRR